MSKINTLARLKRDAISDLKIIISEVQDCTNIGDIVDIFDDAKNTMDISLDRAYDAEDSVDINELCKA